MKINFREKFGVKEYLLSYVSKNKISLFEREVIKEICSVVKSEIAVELQSQIDLKLFKHIHRIDGLGAEFCYSELIFVPKKHSQGNFNKKEKEDGRSLVDKGFFIFHEEKYKYKIWSNNGVLLSLQVLNKIDNCKDN